MQAKEVEIGESDVRFEASISGVRVTGFISPDSGVTLKSVNGEALDDSTARKVKRVIRKGVTVEHLKDAAKKGTPYRLAGDASGAWRVLFNLDKLSVMAHFRRNGMAVTEWFVDGKIEKYPERFDSVG